MKLPKKLKIGGHTFTVELLDKLENDAFGTTMQAKNLLQFRKGIPASQLESTFLHEILHVINYNLTEEQVEYIANGLYQVIVDNKIKFDGK